MNEGYSNTSVRLIRLPATLSFAGYLILTMEDAFKPGAKPIKTAMVILCDQGACSMVITFVSTAISTDTAIRISQGRTTALKKIVFILTRDNRAASFA